MTFNDLHNGLEGGCNCIEQEGVSEVNTADVFARVLEGETLSINDFRSHHEKSKMRPKYPLKNCRSKCMWRGVSINKVNGNEGEIKQKLITVGQISPEGLTGMICKFRINADAGKVWDTSGNNPDAHHTLLKADGFNLLSIEVVKVVSAADF